VCVCLRNLAKILKHLQHIRMYVHTHTADLLRKEYTKVQAGRRGMPNIEKATDAEIDSYVMGKLRRIQAEGFGMPGLTDATDAEISRYVSAKLNRIQAERLGMPNLDNATDAAVTTYVMGNMTAVRVDAIDELTDRLIQSLPPTHRLHNFRSDIPARLAEIDESVNKARCNKFERSEHILTNFGIHAQLVFNPYRVQLNKSCAKARNETMADQIQAKFVHVTLHPFPLEDRILEFDPRERPKIERLNGGSPPRSLLPHHRSAPHRQDLHVGILDSRAAP
jgi:hypothetical protein